jgi:hypothetical protein
VAGLRADIKYRGTSATVKATYPAINAQPSHLPIVSRSTVRHLPSELRKAQSIIASLRVQRQGRGFVTVHQHKLPSYHSPMNAKQMASKAFMAALFVRCDRRDSLLFLPLKLDTKKQLLA